MNLHITSQAKQNQISFLISMDNYLSNKKRTKTTQFMIKLNDWIVRKHPSFDLRARESQNNRIEIFNENKLVGYYQLT